MTIKNFKGHYFLPILQVKTKYNRYDGFPQGVDKNVENFLYFAVFLAINAAFTPVGCGKVCGDCGLLCKNHDINIA